MRKKHCYIIGLLLCAFTIHAQQKQELKLDKASGRRISNFFSAANKGSTMGIGIGYQKPSFFNTLYYDNSQGTGNIIQNKGGVEITYFVQVCPVLLDFGVFSSSFNVNSGVFYPEYSKKSTLLQGLDIYLSYAPLLPDYGKISEILTPYIGAGYQTSSIVVEDDSKKDNNTIASLGTSSPMWKGGLRINLGGFYIKGEYKQSLFLNKPTAFSVIAISAGWRL